jgi:hypothetical protein
MEAAEVDESVGAQEEVGDDGGNGVELSFRDPGRKRAFSEKLYHVSAWHPNSQGGGPQAGP